MRIIGVDPGFAAMAVAEIEWGETRELVFSEQVKTKPPIPTGLRWSRVLACLATYIDHTLPLDARIACEEISGARHGHDDRGTSGAQSDPLQQVVGAARMQAHVHGLDFVLIRSQTVYSAIGATIKPVRGETRYARKVRQKSATRSAVLRLLKIPPNEASQMSPDEFDACAIAIACALGKGESQ